MFEAKPFRRIVIQVFIGVTILLGSSIMMGLYGAWVSRISDERKLLERNASTVSTHVQRALNDATKLVDIAHIRLQAELTKGALSQSRARSILEETINQFTLYNVTDHFGLLFTTDATGNLYAQSNGPDKPLLNFADRYYFSDLKQHPHNRLTIGNLVFTRTTNRYAFHLAKPLQDQNGNFFGVIVQQILEDDLAESLAPMMSTHKDRVYTYAQNKQISFSYPPTQQHKKVDQPNATRLLDIVSKDGYTRNSLKLDGVDIGLAGTFYLGYAWSSEFGMYTVAVVSERLLLEQFLSQHLFTLGYSMLAFLVGCALFIMLYRQAKNLERSRLLSTHDALTGLHNRRSLNENLMTLCRDSMRVSKPISVIFADIDHFKQVNDRYGHETGDIVLKAVASAIEGAALRPMDFCCRWGGEEFVSVLPETTQEGAQLVAERMATAVRNLKIPRAGNITISIGIATLTLNAKNLDMDIVSMADQAMLAAKAAGRNQIKIFGANGND